MSRTRPAATVIQEEFSKTTQRGMYAPEAPAQISGRKRGEPAVIECPDLPERGEPVRADP